MFGSPMNVEHRPRYEALDGVRMLAAIAILVHHAHNPMGLGYGVTSPDLSLAVFVFFSLSGFLVFRPFARGLVSTRDHLTRRLLRIFPAYLVALAATFLFAGSPPVGEGLRNALMIQVPETGQPLGVLAVAWSLPVE